MPTAPLAPEHALAYLRELQPEAAQGAVIGPDGSLLAGVEGPPAVAARALLERGDAARARAEAVLAVACDGHAAAAVLPDAASELAAFDLASVASAVAASFVG